MATRTRNGLLNVRLSPDSDRREDISAGPSRADCVAKVENYRVMIFWL
jgi:hypothetical protein